MLVPVNKFDEEIKRKLYQRLIYANKMGTNRSECNKMIDVLMEFDDIRRKLYPSAPELMVDEDVVDCMIKNE